MSMPSALIGFAFFKSLQKHLDIPFTPVENVLVQTVAGAMGTMPLGCGFVGVMPAFNYLLTPDEGGPIFLGLGKMIIWALGLCFFGVVFAVPLRRQVIIREKLKFPSGTATALMISVLHGQDDLKTDASPTKAVDEEEREGFVTETLDPRASVSSSRPAPYGGLERRLSTASGVSSEAEEAEEAKKWATGSWRERVKLLIIAFGISGVYTFLTYFFPVLRNLPIFGANLATNWLWTLNPSPAYVGQGIIMGPATTVHMLLGAILGWGFLSPLAKNKGWAPAPIGDWENGSKGWIIWVSLAIMLADSIISLGYIAFRPIVHYITRGLHVLLEKQGVSSWKDIFSRSPDYTPIQDRDSTDLTNVPTNSSLRPLHTITRTVSTALRDLPDVDAPPEHLVSTRTVWIGLTTSGLFCIASIHITFGTLIPVYLTTIAVLLALVLSIMGVRALGETDLNPVSGISKLAQLFFALIIPSGTKNAVLINLIAGAVSEAGALQAGDLMQDLKTGHLLGAAPNAQFYGQLIGSAVGAVVSACIYRLYTSVYQVPGDLFQVPTGYVWVFTARLVTGKGLPAGVAQWAAGAAVIWTIATVVRIWARAESKWWREWVPGGIAVAVGMYNVPSFTLARAIGGLMAWYWKTYLGKQETPLVVVASGLVLGEGVVSILSLGMASVGVPHF